MYKKLFIPLVAACVISMTSCRSYVVPQSINTTAKVAFADLNLERNDYVVLNTISAEASVVAKYSKNKMIITDASNEFSATWKKGVYFAGRMRRVGWILDMKKLRGIVRLGYLSNDYDNIDPFDLPHSAHDICRNLAIYRLINAQKIAGGDAIIEPVISTNVERGKSYNEIVYKTTITAKLVKIKPNGK